MTRWLLALGVALTAGCLSPRSYPCDSDADCTGRDGGRCEAEGVCSFFDDSCDSGRRYAEHAGTRSNVCTTPIAPRALRNACVAGEPWPTTDDPCASAVCDVVPACCETTWGEACVGLADQLCDVHCGEWIAATSVVETRVLAWTGVTYEPRGTVMGGAVGAWLDARDGRPRLALGVDGRGLSVFGLAGADPMLTFAQRLVHNAADLNPRAIAAVDGDGDDTVEIGYASIGAGSPHVAVLEPTEPIATPQLTTPAHPEAEALAWADYTGDRVPDLAVGTANGYRLLFWSTTNARYELAFTSSPATGRFRSVAWGDVDGDQRLDLIALGPSIHMHRGDGEAISSAATYTSRTPLNAIVTGAVGDLDGDHRADIVAAVSVGETAAGMLTILHGWNATTSELSRVEIAVPRVHALAVRDVDDDGLLDVIVATEGGGLSWLRNTGGAAGSVTLAAPATIPVAAGATGMSVTGWPDR